MPTLTLAQANQIVAKALEKARAMKIKPVTVVVLDDAGHLKAMQREDG
ncbi:MAG TPA: heme-binding protein, partial [Gammaproteobacteria bacterium]|nr:heme-binding protein [Gammaproteobacteria bacterium]